MDILLMYFLLHTSPLSSVFSLDFAWEDLIDGVLGYFFAFLCCLPSRYASC